MPVPHQVGCGGAVGTAQVHGLLVPGPLPAVAADGAEEAGDNKDADGVSAQRGPGSSRDGPTGRAAPTPFQEPQGRVQGPLGQAADLSMAGRPPEPWSPQGGALLFTHLVTPLPCQ